MQAMYTEQTLGSVGGRLNRRLIVLFAVIAVLLAVFVWAMVSRVEWLAMVSVSVAGCFAIFFVDLLCLPLVQYRRLVRSALSGRLHTKELEFSHVEPDLSVVDGVACRSMIFLGEPDKHGSRDILLYWDNEFPLPELEPGETVSVEYTGKNITGLQRAGQSSRP